MTYVRKLLLVHVRPTWDSVVYYPLRFIVSSIIFDPDLKPGIIPSDTKTNMYARKVKHSQKASRLL